eukprot:gb/GECG01006644.1/.p1 GENE.gb/GECG01006644.1/~~gb/GECG01006644.1/.p1  ORF type:complete len:205 (+),score=6.19 gb/GECG01006644.1/:1-615(+)
MYVWTYWLRLYVRGCRAYNIREERVPHCVHTLGSYHCINSWHEEEHHHHGAHTALFHCPPPEPRIHTDRSVPASGNYEVALQSHELGESEEGSNHCWFEGGDSRLSTGSPNPICRQPNVSNLSKRKYSSMNSSCVLDLEMKWGTCRCLPTRTLSIVPTSLCLPPFTQSLLCRSVSLTAVIVGNTVRRTMLTTDRVWESVWAPLA